MSEVIPYINKEQLHKNIDISYYWSNDFSPEFYIDIAKRGLISTSLNNKEYGDLLLPEMQEAYAVLNFEDLHIGKKIKKLFNSNYKLKINQDLDTFIPFLKKHHGNECWFTQSYITLMYNLLSYTLEKNNFLLQTTILYSGENITSGEIGYFIGKTYTSLTGFYNNKFSNWGTFQLVLLSQELKKRSMAFWNLGHPYMDYKKKLGAQILPNKEFLNLWYRHTQPPIEI